MSWSVGSAQFCSAGCDSLQSSVSLHSTYLHRPRLFGSLGSTPALYRHSYPNGQLVCTPHSLSTMGSVAAGGLHPDPFHPSNRLAPTRNCQARVRRLMLDLRAQRRRPRWETQPRAPANVVRCTGTGRAAVRSPSSHLRATARRGQAVRLSQLGHRERVGPGDARDRAVLILCVSSPDCLPIMASKRVDGSLRPVGRSG